jgi:hypothetical protein
LSLENNSEEFVLTAFEVVQFVVLGVKVGQIMVVAKVQTVQFVTPDIQMRQTKVVRKV